MLFTSLWFVAGTVLMYASQFTVEGRKREQQKDACPGVTKPPDSNIKLHPFPTDAGDRMCCGCNKGYYVDGLCSSENMTDTKCVRCPVGTYIDQFAHNKRSCQVDDLVCPKNTIKISSQPDQAPRCDCYPGYFKTKKDQCEPHSLCPPGEGVKSPGTPFADTVCERCQSGYESPRNSAVDGCRLKDSLRPSNFPPTSTTKTTTIASPTICPPCNSSGLTAGIIYGGIILFVVIVVIALVCWCNFAALRRCRRRNDPEVRYKHNEGPQSSSPMSSKSSFIEGSNVCDSGVSLQTSDSNETTRFVTGPPTIESLKVTSEPCCSKSLLQNEHDQINQPLLSSYDKTMNKVKVVLEPSMSDKEIYRLFRKLTTDLVKHQEVYLSKIKKENDPGEQFCKVFDKLKSCLREEGFNVVILHQYFIDEKRKDIADDLKRFLPQQG